VPVEGADGARRQREGVRAGAYVVRGLDEAQVDVTLVASGSEVAMAVEAAGRLQQEGLRVRVVSVPCRERLAAMPLEARRRLLAHPSPCVVVEAGVGRGWGWLVGERAELVGVTRFGESAPAAQAAAAVGLTVDRVVEAARRLVASR